MLDHVEDVVVDIKAILLPVSGSYKHSNENQAICCVILLLSFDREDQLFYNQVVEYLKELIGKYNPIIVLTVTNICVIAKTNMRFLLY